MVKDMLSGFSVIKSFKAELEVVRLFSESNRDIEDAKCKRRMTEIIMQAIGFLTGVTAQFGVFIFGAYLALTGQGVTAGIVIVFAQLMNFLLTPISEVPQILANRKAANALIDKLAAALHSNIRQEGNIVDNSLDHAIELKNVFFSYEKDSPILNNIDICFEAGKSYAIVGGSGSGKSTSLYDLVSIVQ